MRILLSFTFLLCSSIHLFAQQASLHVETYTLDNGLTVYLNYDQNASDVFGAVVVKAGSKDDPADATGIAHYLEHLLFKGTNELGTTDYEKEKPHLDSINMLYDKLGQIKDEEERKKIQLQINDQSLKASEYGLPNEFDNLIKGIGGTGVNAFTSADMTVYHNSFPGEQLDKWLQLYSHRFINPVFRSFQSELEVVYEEKNRSMDNLQSKLFETVNSNLYKNHPYGTQSTLGTVEHLKNPSLTRMYAFFNKYYVSNNMALVLCGNFDTSKAKESIENYFTKLNQGPDIIRATPVPYVIPKNEVVKVKYTPIKVGLIGYKTIPSNHEDQIALTVALGLLYNSSSTGSIDKLVQNGELMEAGGFDYSMNEDGSVLFFIVPKLIGQSFEKAEKLVLNEIDKLKKGDVPPDLLEVVKTELYRGQELSNEKHSYRGYSIASLFSTNETWDDYLKYSEKVNNITLEDVKRVANKYFSKNYFTLRSGTGFPKKTTLEKPGYEPVSAKTDLKSTFAQNFEAQEVEKPEPRFINPTEDITQIALNGSNTLYHVANPINDIFKLNISFRVGSDTIPNLEIATSLSYYFYTVTHSLDSLKLELGKLGLSYSISSWDNSMNIYLTGIERNLDASLKLISSVVYNPTFDKEKLKIIYDDTKSQRKFEIKDPGTVGDALSKYAIYGNRSSYIDKPTLKELKKLEVSELLAAYQKALTYNGHWHFTGTTSPAKVKRLLTTYFPMADNNLEVPFKDWKRIEHPKTIVYVTHDKKAVQSSVHFSIASDPHRYTLKSKVDFSAFNQYMGGGFSGIILQEIREYRSLAYSSYGYLSGRYQDDKPVIFSGYIGCQSDKTNEAITVMLSLLDSMPVKPERIDMIRDGLKNSAAARYPNFRNISYYVEIAERYGPLYLMTEEQYQLYDSLTFEDILAVYNRYLINRPKVISVSGNLKKVDLDKLAELGKVVKVKKKALFVK